MSVRDNETVVGLARTILDYFAYSPEKAKELGMKWAPFEGLIMQGEVKADPEYYPTRQFEMSKRVKMSGMLAVMKVIFVVSDRPVEESK